MFYSSTLPTPLLIGVPFSHSVVSNSLRPHGLQHTRLPCPSPTPGTYSKLMNIKLVMPSNHLIVCHPLLLLPSIFPSIRVFSNESVLCIRWPKYFSFSFNISPFNEFIKELKQRIWGKVPQGASQLQSLFIFCFTYRF